MITFSGYFQNAVKVLNSLQSNAETIVKARENKNLKLLSIPKTVGILQTLGLSLDVLDSKLGVIHVAGTKGKGSTCAFTESILRHAGLKTGFFSSPHLISVRERIRINGNPLTRDQFAKTFFWVYNKLKPLREPGAPYEMPSYFRFLTCMAFHVFLEENVDAVVLEVGVGGRYDSTNVIRKPVVVGITSLGLDHQIILGNTLEEIAFDKAGIMKEGVPVYTVDSHPLNIMQLLRSHAEQVRCPFYKVPTSDAVGINLGLKDGMVSTMNATLAVHLANEFLSKRRPSVFPNFPNPLPTAAELSYSSPQNYLPFQIIGLKNTKWDGRFQVLKHSSSVTYFLDGAHTVESLEVALKWFTKVSSSPATSRVLVFNTTGDRSAASFLAPFASSGLINLAIFCPIRTSSKVTKKQDNWAALDTGKDLMAPCRDNVKVWTSLQNSSEGVTCPCAESTVNYINHFSETNATSVDVLITGSLHLVGTFLGVLNPKAVDE